MRFVFQTLFVFILFLSIAGCKKTTTSNNNNNNNTTTWNWSGTDPMSCTIDGSSWICASGEEAFDSMSALKVVSGMGQTDQIVAITMPTNLTAGTEQTISGTNLDNFANIENNTTGDIYSTYYTTGGKMKILENDATHIKGLFYFSAKNPISGVTKNITNGYFNIVK